MTDTTSRTTSRYYSIGNARLMAIAEAAGCSIEQASDYLLCDWDDTSHQRWLDTAPVAEVAGWLADGLASQDDDRDSDDDC